VVLDIGKIIREEWEKQGLSYSLLARQAKCSSRAISSWVTGKRTIIMEMADKVLSALEVSLQIGRK
jgi:plasmid maintenance system antidote protein VapI